MCNDAVNINICCFISDFRPVVNFNHVSSPKFVLSRKVLLMSAPLAYRPKNFEVLCTNFVLRVRLVDVINCAKLYRNRLRGLVSVKGRSLTIGIGLRCRR